MKNTKEEMKKNYISLVEQEGYRHFEKLCKLFAFIILVAFPLVLSPGLYKNLTLTKFVVFAAVTSCFIIACIILLLRYYRSKDHFENSSAGIIKNLTISQILVIAFMIWSIISALASDFSNLFIGQGRYEGVLSVCLYSMTFILLSFWGEFTNRYIYGLASMAIIFGFLGFTQIMGSRVLYPLGSDFDTLPFVSTIGNIDCASGLIAMVLPVLCISFVFMESKLRFLNLAGIVFLTYMQMAIDVDSGKLGLAVALTVTIPFILNSKRNIGRCFIMLGSVLATIAIQRIFVVGYDELGYLHGNISCDKVAVCSLIIAVFCAIGAIALHMSSIEIDVSPKRIALFLGVIIVILTILGLVFIYAYKGNNPLLSELSAAMHGNLADDAGSGRWIVWKRTFSLVLIHPIIGSGTGSFLSAFAPLNVGLPETFDAAHNDFLNIAACQGLVGLLLYLAFLVSLAIRAFKNVFKCPWTLVFIGAIAGYLTHSFFSFSIAIITPLFWVMAGLLDKMVRQIPESATGLVWPREEIELIENNNANKQKAVRKEPNRKNKNRKHK